jgi:flagellar hook-length control protein FliK
MAENIATLLGSVGRAAEPKPAAKASSRPEEGADFEQELSAAQRSATARPAEASNQTTQTVEAPKVKAASEKDDAAEESEALAQGPISTQPTVAAAAVDLAAGTAVPEAAGTEAVQIATVEAVVVPVQPDPSSAKQAAAAPAAATDSSKPELANAAPADAGAVAEPFARLVEDGKPTPQPEQATVVVNTAASQPEPQAAEQPGAANAPEPQESALKLAPAQAQVKLAKQPEPAQPVSEAGPEQKAEAAPRISLNGVESIKAKEKLPTVASETADADMQARMSPRPVEVAAAASPRSVVAPGAVQVPVEVDRLLAARGMTQAGVMNQIVREAAISIRQGHSEVTVQLYPPELGSVRVHLVWDAGKPLEGSIVAQNEATCALIERNIDQLRASLERSGIDVGRFDVSTQGQQQGGEAFERPSGAGVWEPGDAADQALAAMAAGAVAAGTAPVAAGRVNILV